MKKIYGIVSLILILIFLPCSLFVPLALGGDSITESEKWQILQEISSQQKIAREDLDKILHIIQQVNNKGFPIDPFLNKALEGMVKKVPPSSILDVLKVKLEYFFMCRDLLGKIPGISEEPSSQRQQSLIVMSESLARGISKKELEELSMLAPEPRSVNLANASEDLATFKNMGFSPGDAMEIVQSGLRHGVYNRRNPVVPMMIREAREKGISNQELKNIFLTNFQRGKRMEGILHYKNQGTGQPKLEPKGRGPKLKGGLKKKSRPYH